jgi:hypothetical protein
LFVPLQSVQCWHQNHFLKCNQKQSIMFAARFPDSAKYSIFLLHLLAHAFSLGSVPFIIHFILWSLHFSFI